MDHRVKKVLELMRTDPRRELSLEEMARFVNLSPSHLRHLFRREVGEPPVQYLRSLRIQRARDLLENTFLSVKEIMERVGVSDKSNFIRAFKNSYGLTPAQHRMRAAGRSISPESLTDLDGLSVLLVGAGPETQDLVVMLLELSGARVTPVESAGAALRALESARPDVIVADTRTPGDDGHGLIRNIREGGRRIPAVALLTYARAEDRTRALWAGYQMHVPKPIDPAELTAVIGNLARWTTSSPHSRGGSRAAL